MRSLMMDSNTNLQEQHVGLEYVGEHNVSVKTEGSCDARAEDIRSTFQGGRPSAEDIMNQDGEVAEQMLLLHNITEGLEEAKDEAIHNNGDLQSEEEETDEELADDYLGDEEEEDEEDGKSKDGLEEGEIQSDDDFGEEKEIIGSISIFEYQEDELVQKGHLKLQGLMDTAEKCDQCHRQFTSVESLRSHMRTHADNDQKYVCRYCKKEFSFKVLYKQHLKSHRNKKYFMCSLCGKRFSNKWYLTQHEHFHQGRLKCSRCSQYFVTKQSLKNHMKQHMVNGPKKRGRPRKIVPEVLASGLTVYRCHHCSEPFQNLALLNRHIRSHNQQSFKCEVCGKEFSMFPYLKQHLRTHDKTRSYMCQYCGKTFLEPWYCKRHEMTHTESPALKCRYCHIAFATLSNYKRHLRKHTGEKPFVCQYCGKGFAEKGTLQRHERTHTGVKPFSCKTCGKSFTVAHAMKRHEKTHTAQKSFQCKLCSKSYYASAMLERHLKVHEQDIETIEIPSGGLQIVEQDPAGNVIELLTNVPDVNTAKLTEKFESADCVGLGVSAKPGSLQVDLQTTSSQESHIVDQHTESHEGSMINNALMAGQFVQQVQLQDGRNVYATVFEKGSLGNWQVHVHDKQSESK